MANAFILRRAKLGRTSAREIAAKSNNILGAVRNDKKPKNFVPAGNWCIRWGCTSELPAGVTKVLNDVKAIHGVNDKVKSRMLFAANGLAPTSWDSFEKFEQDAEKTFPVIIRPSHHAQGRNLYFCKNLAEAAAAWRRVGGGGYISVFINKVSEYRVFVAQGRAVWVAKKTPGNPQDIAWNVAKGGTFDNVRWEEWPLKAVKTAITAFNLTELDFGGVDIMLDAEGECYVLEINSAPSQTSPYRQSCCSKVFDYILEKENKKRIPLVDKKGGYLKFIHPALDAKAY